MIEGSFRVDPLAMHAFDDILIHDELESCPYLPGLTARMPLHVPSDTLSGKDIDERLASGQRRTGDFVYQTQCPTCQACQSIRVPVQEFEFSSSMKRTIRRNDQILSMSVQPVKSDPDRAKLFNLHREKRGLGRSGNQIDVDDYEWAFARSCFKTFEINYCLDGNLVCVAIVDQGETSLSAVYTYFDPQQARLSLGTYSILKQIEYGKERDFRYLYLGFYIAECQHMTYKSRFLPNERLIDGKWQRFERDATDLPCDD